MINLATLNELDDVVRLSLMLWPEHTVEEMTEEFTGYINDNESEVFIAIVDKRIIAFAQVGLRHDYVEGTETSPVGYFEGIFVEDKYRQQGYASELVHACEEWSREKGCSEFASDIEMDNIDSYQFHLKYGFSEANRIICFQKRLD